MDIESFARVTKSRGNILSEIEGWKEPDYASGHHAAQPIAKSFFIAAILASKPEECGFHTKPKEYQHNGYVEIQLLVDGELGLLTGQLAGQIKSDEHVVKHFAKYMTKAIDYGFTRQLFE